MIPYTFLENDRVTELPTSVSPRGTTPETRAREGIAAPGWKHERVLPALCDKSIAFIREQAASQTPFFLYVPVNGPHTPVVPNPQWIGKSACGVYGDFVMEIDDVLGQLVKALKETGVYDNTIVCFSSDNGPETFTQDYREKYGHSSTWRYRGWKRHNWEGGHRVPLFISWPGTIAPGSRCDQCVELVDFMATLASITGFRLPDDAAEDSFDMFPLWRNELSPAYRPFAIHHSCNGHWAIRKGKWKLILHAGGTGSEPRPEGEPPVQLYDMEADPFETINAYRDHLDVVTELKNECIQVIQNGRTTPGPAQPVERDGDWRELEQLLHVTDGLA